MSARDFPLHHADAISWLDEKLRDGGSLEFPNWAIYFDENWEELTGNPGKEPASLEVQTVPSFVLHRTLNGKVTRTPHGSLMEALREVET